jgi:RNA polymerase sigma factor (sigma-70 family)
MSLLMRVRDVSDNGAWQEFVDCYAPRIFGWCQKFGLQEADAADVTQSVLLKLVDQLQRFQYDAQQGRFRSWLKTVTRHLAVDLHRAQQLRINNAGAGSLDDLPADQSWPSEELFQALEAAWREDVLSLAEARVQLQVHRDTWQAYWSTCREQLAAPQVAEKLGLSVSNVYVAKSRVLKLLRAEVKRLDPEGEGG